nr:hypothetical protein [Marseillevirus cajuinensis]
MSRYSYHNKSVVSLCDKEYETLKNRQKEIIERVFREVPEHETLYFGVTESWCGKGYENIWFSFEEGCRGKGGGFWFATWPKSLVLGGDGCVRREYYVHRDNKVETRTCVATCIDDIF